MEKSKIHHYTVNSSVEDEITGTTINIIAIVWGAPGHKNFRVEIDSTEKLSPVLLSQFLHQVSHFIMHYETIGRGPSERLN